MLLSDKVKLTNLKLLVDETFKISSNEKFIVNGEFISVLSINLKNHKYYEISNGLKSLEVPKNWGIFKLDLKGRVESLSSLDKGFDLILKDYFNIKDTIYIGYGDEGMYILISREIKKAA